MKVQRELLLQQLEMVSPGLTSSDMIQQAGSFCFRNGTIYTFNDEVGCRIKTNLDIEGAVPATKLLEMLRNLPDDIIDVEVKKDQLMIHGKKRTRRSGIRLEADVVLQFNTIERPKKWKPLHTKFAEAISIVQSSAKDNENSGFELTCLSISPRQIEAMDTIQYCCYRLKTKLKEPIQVRRKAIANIVPLGMTQFSVTDSWIHFKNSEGLILSCRKFMGDFPDGSKLRKIQGEKFVFPKGLRQSIKAANTFSCENDSNLVVISLKPGMFNIKAIGKTGFYEEDKEVKYKGDKIEFLIAPKMLEELTSKYNECQIIDGDSLKITGDRWFYFTALGTYEKEEKGTDDDD